MDIDFTPTSSFCYNFARYVVFPEIDKLPEVQAGEPFKMVELAQDVISRYLTPEQISATFVARDSKKIRVIGSQIKWYCGFVAKHSQVYVNLGNGMFRAQVGAEISDDELEAEALESGDEELGELSGWIYAFSFPSIVRAGERFPIKVGKTINDVEARVAEQCKGSAVFESPIVLGRWQVKHVSPTELAIHNTLKARGRWREYAPGREWFDTTIDEVDSILKFVTSM